MAINRVSIPERIEIVADSGSIGIQQFNSQTIILHGNDALTEDFNLQLLSSLAAFADDHWVEVFYIANIAVGAFDVTIFNKKLTKAQAAEGFLRIVATFDHNAGTHDIFIDDMLNGNRQGDSSLDLDSNQTISPLEKNDHLIVLDPTTVSEDRIFEIITDPSCNNQWRFLILGGEVDAGFTWEIENNAVTHFTLPPGLIQPQIVDMIWTDAGYHVSQLPLAMNSSIDPRGDLRFGDAIVFDYDFDRDGGAQGTIEFDIPMPDGIILLVDEAVIDTETPLAAGAGTTVEFGIGVVDTDVIQTSLVFTDARYASANEVSRGDGTIFKRVLPGEKPSMTIGVDDITAGKIHVRIPYLVKKY